MLKILHMTNIPLITAEDPGIPVKYTVKVINKEYGKQNQASAKNYYIVYVHILVRARAITCFQSEAIPPSPLPHTKLIPRSDFSVFGFGK